VKNKKEILIASISLILVSVFILSQLKESESAPVVSLESNKEQVTELFQSPRESLKSQSKEVTEECATFWGKLRELDLRNHGKEIGDIRAKTGSDKCVTVPAQLRNLHEFFNAHCKDKTNSPQCLVGLYYYRAALTDYLTKDISIRQISDPKILIDKMIANREINPRLSIEAAERLSEIDPKLYEARKAQVLGRLFLATQEAAENKNGSWIELEEAIEKAKELGNSDPELIEAELYTEMLRSNSSDEALEKSRAIADSNPQEWRGPYYAAWALFKDGRGQEALDYLAEAQQRDPQNSRIREAIEGIKKGDASPFKANISFNDLNQFF